MNGHQWFTNMIKRYNNVILRVVHDEVLTCVESYHIISYLVLRSRYPNKEKKNSLSYVGFSLNLY